MIHLQTTFEANRMNFHVCSSLETFKPNDTYEANLKELLSYLSNETTSKDFSLGSNGFGQNQTHGLALCRGNILATDCATCVDDASEQILKQCPYNEGAVIWYDNCLLRYLNEECFGQLDLLINFYHMCNKDNYPSQPMMFNPKTSNFMSQLAKEAVVNQKMYANRKAKLDGLNIFYGLAQCTRDLSSLFCETCLNNTIKALSYNCYGRQGGRVHTGNCNVRYEMYDFISAWILQYHGV